MKRHPSTNIRVGMWVRYAGRTGIATQLLRCVEGEDGTSLMPAVFGEPVTHVEVHITDDHGDTVLVDHAGVSEVAQARRVDIPEPRRPSEEVAAAFGYE